MGVHKHYIFLRGMDRHKTVMTYRERCVQSAKYIG